MMIKCLFHQDATSSRGTWPRLSYQSDSRCGCLRELHFHKRRAISPSPRRRVICKEYGNQRQIRSLCGTSSQLGASATAVRLEEFGEIAFFPLGGGGDEGAGVLGCPDLPWEATFLWQEQAQEADDRRPYGAVEMEMHKRGYGHRTDWIARAEGATMYVRL